MSSNKNYIVQKATDWIFRKKSILYLLVMAFFRECIAIGASEILTKWEIDINLQDWYVHYPIMALKFIFNGGDWTLIWVLVGLIVFFKISELIGVYFSKKKPDEPSKAQTIINEGYIEKQVNITNVENLKL